ncbi:MAG: 30S ribosomal protein S12 methylthiotransferase RimO [Eubacteriales bacterium]|jgi:ribosomal protein S12 methylthiotransferase|nr:30S ribosomal protein S12 methylthiotransferase RimO [Eubacteriales bacterium]
MEKNKIGFISLGCPKNRVDTEIMLHKLTEAGYEITPEDIEADIIIINTCAFIESAKQESIDNILDVAWLKQRRLKGIIVTGCLSERYREQIFEEMPEVDAILGVGSIDEIVDAVRSVENNTRFAAFGDVSSAKQGGDRIITTPEYTAYIKISEGCDNCCTYCAIPSIRGGFRSVPMETLIEEAIVLERLGVRELVVVAQDTSRYGVDIYGEYRLAALLRAISEATAIPWIRLLYCYPDKITDELIAEIRDNPRIVKYIDLPVQHISDKILTAMNRHGDSRMIRETIAALRREIPDIVIRTTVITGFPGETEEDFTLLCEFVKEMRFERFGVFPYSREEDTPAAAYENQTDEQVKQDRCDRLMQIQLDITQEQNKAKIGNIIEVLCEGFDYVAQTHYGRSGADAPEIDGKVFFSSVSSDERIPEGEFVKIKITESMDYDLIGVII